MIPVWGGGAASAEESAIVAPSRGAGSRGKKRKKKKNKTATTGAAGQLKTRQQDAYMTSSWHTNSADALPARSVDRPRHLSKRARQRKSRRESELNERTRLAAQLSASSSSSSSSSSSASASAASSSSFWRVPKIESECIIDGQSIASIGVARVLPLRKTKFGAKQSSHFRFNGNALCRAVRALRKHGLLPQVMLPFYYCFEDKKLCVGPLCSIAEMRTINQLKHECPVHFVKSSGPDKFDSFFEAYVLEEVRRRDNCFLLSNSNFDYTQKTGLIDEMFVASYVGRVYESSEIDHPNSAKINILPPPLSCVTRATARVIWSIGAANAATRRHAAVLQSKASQESDSGQERNLKPEQSRSSCGLGSSNHDNRTSNLNNSTATLPVPPNIITIVIHPLPKEIPLSDLKPIFEVFGTIHACRVAAQQDVLVVDYSYADADHSLPKLKTLISMGQADFGFAQPLQFQHWDELSSWYYKEDNEYEHERGPLSSEAMERLVRSGKLSLDTPVLEANQNRLPEEDPVYVRLAETCLIAFVSRSSDSQSGMVASATLKRGAIKEERRNAVRENVLEDAAPYPAVSVPSPISDGSTGGGTSRSTSPSTLSKDEKTSMMKQRLQERMVKVRERMREIEATRSMRSRSSSRSPPVKSSSVSSIVSSSSTMTTMATSSRLRLPWMMNGAASNSAAVRLSASINPSLGDEVLRISQWCRLTADELRLRTEFLLYLKTYLRDYNFPEEEGHVSPTICKDVLQFGSTLSGVDTFLSDIDIMASLELENQSQPSLPSTLTDGTTGSDADFIQLCNKEDERRYVTDHDDRDRNINKGPWLRTRSVQDTLVRSVLQLAKSLRELTNVSNCKAVASASIPVIKATDAATGFTVDIVLVNRARVSSLASGVTAVAERIREAANNITLFAPIVHVVQLLLHQHKLDELYSGGMNSFRVYVIVLSFLRTFSEVRADSNDATEALLNFLEFYGRAGILERGSTVDSGLTDEPVSFQAVFRIKDIVHLFRTTHLILARGKRTNGSLLAPILNVARFTVGTCRASEEVAKKLK